MTSRFAIAKEKALEALDDLVPELFGGGRLQTRKYKPRWQVLNRWRGGATIDQMSVWRDGGRRGAWKDYGGTEKGDVIDLVAYGLTGAITDETRMKAVEWLEDRFGIRNMSPKDRAALEEQAKASRAVLEQQDQERNLSDRRRAQKFFFSCAPEIRDTPVEIYLRARGIELDQVPHLSTAFRYREACDYWEGAPRDGEGNKIGQAPKFPAMISAMISGASVLGACHYTFLEPGGAGKLDTRSRGYLRDDGKPKSAKLMYPSTSGLMVPVTYGPSGLKAHDAAAAGVAGWWGVTEGIEDALSAAIGNAELRMHAAGSLSGLMGIPNHKAARGYLIFKDNDWGKPEAVAAFDTAVARLKTFGKPVEVLAMPAEWGKDVNEALNQGE